MVSLSLPAVKQLLMGKGYSKQEEADLLTNIYNRAVKWVSLISHHIATEAFVFEYKVIKAYLFQI